MAKGSHKLRQGSVTHPSERPEHSDAARRVDQSWLLELHTDAWRRVERLIAQMRGKMERSRDARDLKPQFEAAEQLLEKEIPNVIRKHVAGSMSLSTMQPLCDEISKIVTKAKNTMGNKMTKFIQREIQIEFSAAQQVITQALAQQGTSSDRDITATDTVHKNESRADFSDQPPAPEPEVLSDADTSVPTAVPESFLDLLRTEEGLITEAQQRTFVCEKLVSRAQQLFTEFLDATKDTRRGKKLSRSDAEKLLRIFQHTQAAVREHIETCDLTLEGLKSEITALEDLGSSMTRDPALLHENVREEFQRTVAEPLSQLAAGCESDSELLLRLYDIKDAIPFISTGDIILELKWDKLDQGSQAPAEPVEIECLRGLAGKTNRLIKKALQFRSEELAQKLNEAYYGGYEFRDAAFVHSVLESWLSSGEKEDASLEVQPSEKGVDLQRAAFVTPASSVEVSVDASAHPNVGHEMEIGITQEAEESDSSASQMGSEIVREQEGEQAESLVEDVHSASVAIPYTTLVASAASVGEGADDSSEFPEHELDTMCQIIKETDLQQRHGASRPSANELWAILSQRLNIKKRIFEFGYKSGLIAAARQRLAERSSLLTPRQKSSLGAVAQQQALTHDRNLIRLMFERDLRQGRGIASQRISGCVRSINEGRRSRKIMSQCDEEYIRGLIQELQEQLFPPVSPVPQISPVIPDAHVSVAETQPSSIDSSDAIHVEQPEGPVLADRDTDVVEGVDVQVEPVVENGSPELTSVVPSETEDIGTTQVDVSLSQSTSVAGTVVPLHIAPESAVGPDEERAERNELFGPTFREHALSALVGARDAVAMSTDVLEQVNMDLQALNIKVIELSGNLGNALAKVFSEENSALVNTCQLEKGDLAEGSRLQETYDAAQKTYGGIQHILALVAELDAAVTEAEKIRTCFQQANVSSRRAVAFKKQANASVFDMPISEIFTEEELTFLNEIDALEHKLFVLQKDLQNVSAHYLHAMQQEVADARLRNMDLSEVQEFFASALSRLGRFMQPTESSELSDVSLSTAKKNRSKKSVTPEHVSIDHLEKLELSPIQLKLLQILTTQTSRSNPRKTTWGRRSLTLPKLWALIFDEKPPTEGEICTALSDPALMEDMTHVTFEDGPHPGALLPLRERPAPIVLWRLGEQELFMPTLAGFEYMAQKQSPLDPELSQKLRSHFEAGKLLKKQKEETKTKRRK